MMVRTVTTEEVSACLADRKWWCFLLSSVLSFIVGVFSVLFIRACAALLCRRDEELSQSDVKRQLEEEKRLRQQETGQEVKVRKYFRKIFQKNISLAGLGLHVLRQGLGRGADLRSDRDGQDSGEKIFQKNISQFSCI